MTAEAGRLRQVRLVIPVKRLSLAKSRLSHHAPIRRAAAESLYRRTFHVATSCLPPSQVCIVTSDEVAGRHAHRLGASVLSDAAPDLNSTLHTAIETLRSRDDDAILVVLVADLPRLHASELRHALTEASVSSVSRHVADHHGTGTTFVSIPPGAVLPMVFGPGSARRFTLLGSIPLRGVMRGLRTDLDTPTDPFQLELRRNGAQLLPGTSS